MIFSNKYKKILLPLSCIFLLYIIFIWIHYLTSNGFVIECFESNSFVKDDLINNSTSHSVDLPLTTKYSCKNFCGPTARCAYTGQQCFTDIDCPGCKPYIPPHTSKNIQKDTNIPGDDDAGKLTWGVTPQYSSLTSGYGTKEQIITDDVHSKPTQAFFGINTWRDSYDQGEKLFNQRYKPPPNLTNEPNYIQRFTMSGEFAEDGPLPSNSD